MKGKGDFWHSSNKFVQTTEDIKDTSLYRNKSFFKT